MNQRQKALLDFLPECNNNVYQAAIKAGYSESYASSQVYQTIRKSKNSGIEPAEKVKARYLKKVKKLQKKMFKDKDNTNLMRSVEIEGKVEGLFKETVVNEGNTKDITIVYGNDTASMNNNPASENNVIAPTSINDNSPSMNKPIDNTLPKPNDNPSSINNDSQSIPASINVVNEINNHNDNDTKPVSIDAKPGDKDDREGGDCEK